MSGLRAILVRACLCCAGTLLPVSIGIAGQTVLGVGATAPIQTTSGTVIGTSMPSNVQAWLGIPYAAAPVGDLRWREPQPLAWSGVYNADRMMPSCIQNLRPHDADHYFGEEAFSENCLYLNVWASSEAKAGDRLPVIVYVHGGANIVGSGSWPIYSGAAIAAQGAIFVNFNYRLGLIGFLSHPALSQEQNGHSGNYGYLDQVAALKWVHANISQFGGDPDKIVVMGQSAGAWGVSRQIFSPLSKGLFRGAVMSSVCDWSDNDMALEDAERIGLELQKELHVTSLNELRQVPADRFLALQAVPVLGGAAGPGLTVASVIDGYFLPKAKSALLQAHAVNDVPIVLNLNRDESVGPFRAAHTVEEFRSIAVRVFGQDSSDFLKLYPLSSDADVPGVAATVSRETTMQRSERECAILQSRYLKSHAYLSLFSHKQPFIPGLMLGGRDVTTFGVYHTSDIPYWFGTQDAYNKLKITRLWTRFDRELSDQMSEMLISFASTGAPSTPRVNWPAWSPGREVELALDEPIQVERIHGRRIDWRSRHPMKVPAANER